MVAKVILALGFIAQAMALTPSEIKERQEVKAQIFSQTTTAKALAVAAGELPLEAEFTILESVFMHFEIPSHKVAAFEKEIVIPENMHLAKMELLERKKSFLEYLFPWYAAQAYSKYYVTANAYTAKIGPADVVRTDWLTFVTTDEDPIPRYLVIQGFDAEENFDVATGMPESASDYVYTANEGLAPGPVSFGVNDEDVKWKFSFTAPENSRFNQRSLAAGMIPAVGKSYYRNGVVDYAFVNDAYTEQKVVTVPRNKITVDNQYARFAPFMRTPSTPSTTYLFRQPIPLIIQQWANIVDDAILETVADPVPIFAAREVLKSFAGLTFLEAGQLSGAATRGEAQAIVGIATLPQPPSIFINFEVPNCNLVKFKKALNLPPGLRLARMAQAAGTKYGRPRPRYQIALNIYETSISGASQYRAEWSTFVTSEDDGHQKPYFLVVDVASSAASLDVISLFTPAADEFVYGEQDGDLVTKIRTNELSFEASFPMPNLSKCRRGVNYNFIRSNDRIYWGDTGVYDRGFYNEDSFDAKIKHIHTNRKAQFKVTDGTRWADIVNEQPFEAYAFCSPQRYLVQPWFNIGQVEATEEDETPVAPPMSDSDSQEADDANDECVDVFDILDATQRPPFDNCGAFAQAVEASGETDACGNNADVGALCRKFCNLCETQGDAPICEDRVIPGVPPCDFLADAVFRENADQACDLNIPADETAGTPETPYVFLCPATCGAC